MVSDEDEDGCSVVRMPSLCLRWEDTADVRTENKNEAFMVTLRVGAPHLVVARLSHSRITCHAG